jgi:membrane fusion protein
MSALYRPEALTHQKEPAFGKAFLKIPRSYSYFLLFLLTITLLFISLLYLGNYARKETVSGILVSSVGVVQVHSPRNGEVKALFVADGTKVSIKQSLLTLDNNTHLTSGNTLNEQQKKSLNTNLSILDEQINTESLLAKESQVRLQASIGERKSSLWQQRNQLKLGDELVTLKQKQYKQATKLYQQGYLTESAQNDSYQQLLEQQQVQENAKQRIMAQKSELKQLEHDFQMQPLLLKKTLAQLEKQQAELFIRLSLLQAQSSVQIKSSIKGHVTTMQVHEGEHVVQGQLLMTLLPLETTLEAELYLPSRAAGFISSGQEVRLRYSAFSYQRYGIFNGTVIEVSKVALAPNELKVPLILPEAVYRVRVKLDQQSVFGFGTDNSLQPGMSLEADIILDSMSLFDWMLMPIYAIKGRL